MYALSRKRTLQTNHLLTLKDIMCITPHIAVCDNNVKGGSAIIVKNNITYHEELEYKTEHIQASTICVKTKSQALNIYSVYCPPKHSIKREQYKRE